MNKKFIEIEAFWGIDGHIIDDEAKEMFFKSAHVEPSGDDNSPGAGLEELKEIVYNCRSCPLHKTKINYVFGEGAPSAELMFIGEAPGQDEDRQGRPFVGRAGELLTKIIIAMGLKREDVFIANVLKCRPPGNRNPLPDEIAACKGYLLKQVEMVSPKVICTLGKFSSFLFTNSSLPISKIRGQVFEWKGIKVVPTFHPAFLLRNPKMKYYVWEDAKTILSLLGRPIPK